MRPLDLVIVIAYLGGIVAVGIACRGREASVDEYFTARGRFKGPVGTILLGLSLAATLFSGTSLVVYVSTAFSDGARIVLGTACLPVAWAFLHFWFLPRYMAGKWPHPYSIVENRFGIRVRRCLSAMFVLMRIGWMGVLIYVPAIIVMGVMNLDAWWFWPTVITIGLSSTVYTVIGGIRGVVITDAIQFLIIFAGLLIIIGAITSKLEMGLLDAVRQLDDGGRLSLFDFSLDFTRTFTFWSVVVGLTIANLGSYAADQMALQRYLAADLPKAAIRAFVVNILGAFGLIIILVSVGLLLWVWYQVHPDADRPSQADQILPYFVTREIPAGLSGLLVASILAATMSSVTSGINGIAGAITNDWLAPVFQTSAPHKLYQLGRRISLAIGVASTFAAGFASEFGSALTSSQILMGGFLGSMLACMILAVSSLRVRPGSVLTGMGLGLAAGWAVAFSPVSVLWTAPAALLVGLLVPILHLLAFGPARTLRCGNMTEV